MDISKRERVGITVTFMVVMCCIVIGLCMRFCERGNAEKRTFDSARNQVEVVDSGDELEGDAFVPERKYKTKKKKGRGGRKSVSKKTEKVKLPPRDILRDTINMK